MDEIDALQGNSLVSILSQLRDGHNARPEGYPFPACVVLCGLRDLRDYKVASGGDPGRSNPASPFNLIRDRDGKFPVLIEEILTEAGIQTVLTGIRMPRMNSTMERWV
ncbi:hypothetical protein [Nonomuraea sp. NPDC049784]|uniref:hypothetical protein n=1 Tax=Nonomuraea sp. NPDC049784 TaxID=3154361 RepID=UPI0033C35CB6